MKMECGLAHHNGGMPEDVQLRLVQMTRAQIVVLQDLIDSARRMVDSSRALLAELEELRPSSEQEYRRPEGRLA